MSSSLQISAVEQLHFLTAMFSDKLTVSTETVDNAKQNMYQGTLIDGAAYYGKTSSGWHGRSEQSANHGKLRDGWFVGLVEQGTHQYILLVI